MVPRAGLEPATLGLEVLCSIHLSYQGTGVTISVIIVGYNLRLEMPTLYLWH